MFLQFIIAERQSLEVDFMELGDWNAQLCYFLLQSPAQILALFDAVALEAVLREFEDYGNIISIDEFRVQIINMPIESTIRGLRHYQMDTFVKVSGIVTRRSAVFPQIIKGYFSCIHCGASNGPFEQHSDEEIKIKRCANCQSKGPFNLIDGKVIGF